MNIHLKLEQLVDRLRILFKLKGGDIALVGSYNTLNTGDILILEIVKQFLETKGFQIHIFGKHHTNFSKFDHVIVCGGDVLHDRSESHWDWLNKIACNKIVLFIGVGVPGFYLKSKEQVKELLDQIACITVRDQVSYERLKSVGYKKVDKSFDNAFLLYGTSKLYTLDRSRKKYFGINIKTFQSTEESKKWTQHKFQNNHKVSLPTYISFYRNIIKNYRADYDKIVVINMTKADELFAKKYFEEWVDCIYPYTKSIDKLINRLQIVEAMFCTRYHSLVLSLLTGKPFQCFAYADKVENICRELGFTDYYSRKDLAVMSNNSSTLNAKKLISIPDKTVSDIAHITQAKLDKVMQGYLFI